MTAPHTTTPRRKPKLPRWLIPELRPLVRKAATCGGLSRVEALLFLEGRPGVNAVYANGAGALAEFYCDPWPVAVYDVGGSVLLVFGHERDARDAKRTLEVVFDAAQRIKLAPVEGRA